MADKPSGQLINIDAGDLGAAAKTLIERISIGCGTYFEPHKIIRKAKAEAEADKVKALSKIEIKGIEERALHRLIHEEKRKQENIEAITSQAIEYLPADAEPQNINEDWVTRFLEKCKTISDKEMQDLWAKVLAGEAKKTGAYSKRTLEILYNLDKDDANFFTNVCRFGWNGTYTPLIIIFDFSAEIYKNNGITFAQLEHLEAIGLLKFLKGGTSYTLEIPSPTWMIYFDKTPFMVESKKPVVVGQVSLTEAGRQLFSICGATAVEGVCDYTKKAMQNAGAEIHEFLSFNPAPVTSSNHKA